MGTNVLQPTRSATALFLGICWIPSATVGLCFAADGGESLANREITVELASGRSFMAAVDAHSDGSTLWLRHSLGSGFILRPIDWRRVVRAEIDGQSVSGEELRRSAGVIPGARPLDEGASAPSQIVLGPAQGEPCVRPSRTLPVAEVRSLAVEACLGNWDGDVAVDGLIVEIEPRDVQGTTVPVFGTLEVELIAERVGVVQRPEPFYRLGRWTQVVRPEDFGSYGARYRLPFQAVNPEFDLRWAAHGAVHARLSVAGSGVFEQTDSTARIRPYSAVRDRLEETTGRRFFSGERTGPAHP